MADLVGQTIGRYQITQRLGEGGMAAVYKGFDPRLNRYVAIKVITPGRETDVTFKARFEREARALAALTHSNIVKVYDFGDHRGLPYLVMEFVNGGTLKQYLGAPMPYDQAARLLAPVARALEYAHHLNIVHRDVKPANILLNDSKQPMIADFGIARMENEGGPELTGTGVGIGTPDYMAPEQALGRTIDARADQYSLGMVFYEMVTGRKPFHADTPMGLIVKQTSEPLPKPKLFVPNLPDEVEQVLYKVLAKNPTDRYPDMGGFAQILEKFMMAGTTAYRKPEGGRPAQTQTMAAPVPQPPSPVQSGTYSPPQVSAPFSPSLSQAGYPPPLREGQANSSAPSSQSGGSTGSYPPQAANPQQTVYNSSGGATPLPPPLMRDGTYGSGQTYGQPAQPSAPVKKGISPILAAGIGFGGLLVIGLCAALVFAFILPLLSTNKATPTPTLQIARNLTATQAPSLAVTPGGITPTRLPTNQTATIAPPKAPTSVPGSVTTLDDAKNAVIQIEAVGMYMDPGQSQTAGSWRGSGFIIDPSGIAITNNHVVTGAATISIWVGGNTNKTYNAKVLGASECNDLAVIKIEGGPFPFLTWTQTQPKQGVDDVFAAGFPLGDPAYTLTKGVISKPKANGNTSWAANENVIEHTAKINPGNSGGPLLDIDGHVVGVNYRIDTDSGMNFAIDYKDAAAILDQLEGGKDVDSIGVNGEAVSSKDGKLVGIWVSSVKPGSPADKARLQPGDIITELEGISLAADGTMADYCNVLRSHDGSSTMNLKVLRYPTNQTYEGQLNGRELAATGGGTKATPKPGSTPTPGSPSGTYSGYVSVKDDSGSISVEAPIEWNDLVTSAWASTWTTNEGNQVKFNAPAISASTNVDSYNNGYSESGVFFTASHDFGKIGGYIQFLDDVRYWHSANCTLEGRHDLSQLIKSPNFDGVYDHWTNCEGNKAHEVFVLTMRPKNNPTGYLVLLEVKITNQADYDVLDNILNTADINL